MLASLFSKKSSERFVSVDVGTSAIKLMELDLSHDKPKLVSIATAATPGGSISNNQITRTDQIAGAVRSLLDANDIAAEKAVLCVPGPSAFTKKVTLGMTKAKDLSDNILFEASNYIPHKIEAVHLDYQVLRVINNASIEVLLVAVKNEVIGGYIDAIAQTGLTPAIGDVDYFALENMFQLNYPEDVNKTCALVNIGARYTSVNILQDGQSLFTGDVSVGGRLYTDALCETLSLEPRAAEKAKMGQIPDGVDANLVNETIDRTTEHVATELHRQIGFFWNAAATDRSIDTIYLSGGGALSPGLLDELAAKTGLPCVMLDPFRQIDTSSGFDADFLSEVSSQMAVSVGLALRRFGDKKQVID